MARDEVRVASVLSACIFASVAGALWAADIPPMTAEQAEERARWAEEKANEAEVASEPPDESLNEAWEEFSMETEEDAREAEISSGN